MTSIPSATQRQSISTLSVTPGTSSCNTPAPSGTSQIDSTRHVVSSPTSGIASTPTPLSSLENLSTPISNPEAHAIITNLVRTRATERNPTQAVPIATAGGVYTMIHDLRLLQNPSIWSLRPNESCICNGQTAVALHVEQTAIYDCKRLGDGKLCNMTHCESIS
jgi:hypothetical protein